MNTLTLYERMNFSNKVRSVTAIKLDKKCDINYLETLKLYCTNNDINIDLMSDELSHCADVIGGFATGVSGPRYFYFWIDKD